MEDKDFCCYEFGEFRLDARRRSLSKNGERVPLSARNFDLLLFMVENDGRVLEHDELLDKVWTGTFVEQATLKKGISALRQILAEEPGTEFIKTIPRRGYSFVSPVRVVPEEKERFLIRETEQEIIVEEYEEIDNAEEISFAPEKIIEIPVASAKELPSGETKKTNYLKLLIFAGTGIAVLVLAFFGLKYFSSKNVQQRFLAENVRITRITNNGKVTSGVSASADGNYIVYPATEKEGTALWLRQVVAKSATRLTPPMRGSFYGFGIAPDNAYVYYIFDNILEPAKSGLYKIPLLGGEPQRIAEDVGNFAISPDSKRLAVVHIKENVFINTINTDGEDERPVMTVPVNSRLWSIRWTLDGSSLLCSIRRLVDDKNLYYIAEISPETGKETVILPPQEKIINGAEWLPDKSALLVVVREDNADIRQIWQYFPASQEWRRITNDNNYYQSANITRDGKTIFSTQISRLAAIWTADGTLSSDNKSLTISRNNFRQITDGVSSFDKVIWLSDGRLAYSATEDGKETIFTINADGTNARQITNGDDGLWIFPNVSGNGQNICFLSSRSGTRQVWRIDLDGKNPVKMTEAASPPQEARILRDNSTVYYAGAMKTGGTVLFKQTPDSQVTQLTDSDTGYWAISPDEKLLAIQILDKATRKYHVELRSMEDGKIIQIFNINPARQLIFTPDGKNLAYDTKIDDVSQIMLQPVEGGEPHLLTDFQMDDIFSFGWSFDGTRLAVIRGKQLNDAVLIKTIEH